MSIKVMSLVFGSDIPWTDRYVMLSLADWARDDGSKIFPALATVAKKTGMSKSSVQRCIKRLLINGNLVLVYKSNNIRPNEYRIDVHTLLGSQVDHAPDSQDDQRVVSDRTQGVVKLTTNTLTKRQLTINKKKKDNATHPAVAGRLITFLNTKAKTNIKMFNPKMELTSNALTIIKILKQGYTEQECKTVITRQWRLWKDDPKMQEYIRVTTIFRKSNFQEYLARCV